jgi:predicted dehydrogenase
VDVQVPTVVAGADPRPAKIWRTRRRQERRHPGPGTLAGVTPLSIALVTDGTDPHTAMMLRAAGAHVTGLLGPEPFESLAWSAASDVQRAYVDLQAVLSDEVEAVCIDLAPPGSDALLSAAVHGGMDVLLASPRYGSSELLGRHTAQATEADVAHCVAFDTRAWPSARFVENNLASVGQTSQITVLGCPSGDVGRAEIVDLVMRWCADVIAVCAHPGTMPADQLGPGAPVTLALLTETGATALVSEQDDAALAQMHVTVVGTTGRYVLRGSKVQHQDGGGITSLPMPPMPGGRRPGLLAAVHELAHEAGFGAPPSTAPHGATLRDLLAVARVLEAAETSARYGGWIEL